MVESVTIPKGNFPYLLGDNHDEKKIEFRPNESLPKNFWGDKVNSVHAIVGANGSGKTSILRLICNKFYNTQIKKSEGKEPLIIYYSPFLEDEFFNDEDENVLLLTATANFSNDCSYTSGSFNELHAIHCSEKLIRWINFLIADSEKELLPKKIKIPRFEKLRIDINLDEVLLHDTPLEFRAFYETHNEILNRTKKVYYENDINRNEKDFQLKGDKVYRGLLFIRSIIIKLFKIFEFTGNRYLDEGRLRFKASDFKGYEDLKKAFYDFLDQAYIEFPKKKYWLPKKEIKAMVEILLEVSDRSTIDPKNLTYLEVDFKDGAEIVKCYQSFIKAFNDNFRYDKWNFMSIRPSKRLSSGESAMYNLFSGLYSAQNTLENDRLKPPSNTYGKQIDFKNVVLLLDEADLGFHPLWKKRYLNTILQVLPKIFMGEEIQIIFTTHDPLTLSDIPSANIIYLDGHKNNDSISYGKQQTFGANIADLLKDSFFIKSEFIGDFAMSKIEYIIELINKSRDSVLKDEEKVLVKKLIDLIDEPILKLKLGDMYAEVTSDIEYQKSLIDSEITRLSKLKDAI